MIRPPAIGLGLLVLSLAACGGGSDAGVIVDVFPKTGLRIEGEQSGGGAGDALAASLQLSLQRAAPRPGRARFGMGEPALMLDLEFKTVTHLQTAAFLAAAGADLRGSAFLRRLAAAGSAPADSNGDGSNLDETLELEMKRLARLAGAELPADLRPVMMPWVAATAEFSAPPAFAAQLMPVRLGARGEVSARQLGEAMLARVLRAGFLLQHNRGAAPGADAAAGLEGLLLLQQVIAAEETLFASLFVDDAALGGIRFPADYDPRSEPARWVPRRFAARFAAARPAEVESYGLVDRASDLRGLAALLRVGGELAWLASDDNPNPNLRDLFRGNPFGPLPKGTGPALVPSPSRLVTWEDGVARLMNNKCVSCHSGPFASGNFRCDTYANTLLGGDKSRPTSKNPIIVRGDASKSLLYTILGNPPPSGFDRMPFGGPFLKTEEEALVKQWIDDGARSAPAGPPRIGRDLAEVMYKNLIQLHLDPATGALRLRHEGDGAPAWAESLATGKLLQALGSLAHLKDSLQDFDKHLRVIADFAAAELADAQGRVHRDYDLAAGRPGPLADLEAQASLTTGLFVAAELLADAALRTRARVLAQALVREFRPQGEVVFRVQRRRAGGAFTPQILAALLDALRHMAADRTPPEAARLHNETLSLLRPALVFSEISGQGEVLGDGIADSDRNGIPEPALAGSGFGRAPLFVGELRIGLDPEPVTDAPITWSRHILPLFRSKCARCHLDGAAQGGYRMDTPGLVQKAGDPRTQLPLVLPGDPESSYLYRKLVDRNPQRGAQMPLQTPTLSAQGKAMVREWISSGASWR